MKTLIAISSFRHAPPMLAAARMLERSGHTVRLLEGGPAAANAMAAVAAIAPQFCALSEALAQHPAQLVVADADYGGTLPLMLGALRRPPAVVTLGLHAWDDAAHACPAASHAQAALQARANAVLRQLGARPLPLPLQQARQTLPERYLQQGIPAFEVRPIGVPDNFVFLGALLGAAQAADVQASAGPPLVLLPTAEMGGRRAARLAALLAQALAGCAALAPADPRQYAALLPRAALAVTQGCLSTALQAMRAGVPVLCVGADKPAVALAERLAASGAGIGLLHATPGVRALRHAAQALLALPRFRHRAAALSIEFDGFPSESILAACCRPHVQPAVAGALALSA